MHPLKARSSWFRFGHVALVLTFAQLTRACLIDPQKDFPVGTAGNGAISADGGAAPIGSGGAPIGGAGATAGARDAPEGGAPDALGGASGTDNAACAGTDAGRCAPTSCSGLPEECGISRDDGCCTAPTVKGGSFTLGKSTTATVADFTLDKYEVTVGRFRKFVEAYSGPPSEGSGAHPLIADSGWQPSWNASIAADGVTLATAAQCDEGTQTWSATGANDFLPMNCVSWFEAFAFCAWDGGRLPTEAEWEYAAKGGSEARWFPWGNDPIPSGFQDGTSAFANYNCLGDGSAPGACTVADLLAVGSKPAGAGKYGQLDLAGSVREWTLDWHNPLPVSCTNCASLSAGTERVDRGGSWTDETMYVASDNRLLNLPGQHYKFMGVRCARNN